jgi:hypothetical protein
MIKLSRAVVERMVLLCVYSKRHDYRCNDMLEQGLSIPLPKKENQRRVLHHVYEVEGLVSEKNNWDFLLSEMIDALLSAPGTTSHHGSLIDQIVELLKEPYSRNVLSGKTLNALRRAILLPEEMAKVAEAFRKELACAACGKTFVNTEMAIFEAGPPVAFFCTRCTIPSFAACKVSSNCDGVSPLDQKALAKAIGNKPDCGEHSPGKKNSIDAANADLQGILEADEGIRQLDLDNGMALPPDAWREQQLRLEQEINRAAGRIPQPHRAPRWDNVLVDEQGRGAGAAARPQAPENRQPPERVMRARRAHQARVVDQHRGIQNALANDVGRREGGGQ